MNSQKQNKIKTTLDTGHWTLDMAVAAHILAATLAWCLTTINTKPGFYPPGPGSAGSCAQLRSQAGPGGGGG